MATRRKRKRHDGTSTVQVLQGPRPSPFEAGASYTENRDSPVGRTAGHKAAEAATSAIKAELLRKKRQKRKGKA